MSDITNYIISLISKQKFDLTKEKITQAQVQQVLDMSGLLFVREYHLDKINIPDFFHDTCGIAIEVKIKGSKIAIYKQCERYCNFEAVKVLILCTNKAVGFPKEINGKPCYLINIGKAWL